MFGFVYTGTLILLSFVGKFETSVLVETSHVFLMQSEAEDAAVLTDVEYDTEIRRRTFSLKTLGNTL